MLMQLDRAYLCLRGGMADEESDTDDRLVVVIVVLTVLAVAALAVLFLFSTKFSWGV